MVIPYPLMQFSCGFSYAAFYNSALLLVIILIIERISSIIVTFMIIKIIQCVVKLTLQFTPIRP